MTDRPIKIRDNPTDQYCEVWVKTGDRHQPVLGPDGQPSKYRYAEFARTRRPSRDDFERLGRRVLQAAG